MDGYHDHLIFKLKYRVPVLTGPWSHSLDPEAEAQYSRIHSRVEKLLDDHWLEQFDQQASEILDPKVFRKAVSFHACRRCAALAQAAAYTLEHDELPTPPFLSCLLASVGLPCVGVEEVLIGGVSGAEGMLSPVAVGRTMQLIGVQACFRRNRPLKDCYCARDIVRFEGESKLTKLIKYGTGGWEQLGDLGLAA